MKTKNLISGIISGLFALVAVSLPQVAGAVGTWVALPNAAPGPVASMRLLSDGTVMAKEDDAFNNYTNWFILKPGLNGSYTNATWLTNVVAMHDTRLYFSSQMLTNGKVFVAGGEFGTGKAKAEVYDPVSNIWTSIVVPTNLLNPSQPAGNGFVGNQGILDALSEVLPNGQVLIPPVLASYFGQTMIFDPASSSFIGGPNLFRTNILDEASWLKLPDDSILTVDTPSSRAPGGTNSERYIPSLNAWVNDANVPVKLFDPFATETGPCFLLPNGKALFFGSTTNSAIYTPSGSTAPGSWATGPNFPNGQGMPDAPGTMMMNGKILLITSPTPSSGDNAPSPSSIYEYDYLSSSFTPVPAPVGLNTNGASQYFYFLNLPDGSILLSTLTANLFIYQPDGTQIAAGKPGITGVSLNGDGSLHISGTLLGGISEGSTYGDDAQVSTDYPLVRFTDPSGNVRYGRTYGWTSTSKMTGSMVSTTECTLPAGGSLNDTIQVVVNGIASDPVPLTYAQNGITWVDFNYSGGGNNGSFATPYHTMATGVSGAASGGLIEVKTGTSSETLGLTKPARIVSYNGTVHIGH